MVHALGAVPIRVLDELAFNSRAYDQGNSAIAMSNTV